MRSDWLPGSSGRVPDALMRPSEKPPPTARLHCAGEQTEDRHQSEARIRFRLKGSHEFQIVRVRKDVMAKQTSVLR